jgi:hypothetical protein
MRRDAVPTPLEPARLEQLERELTHDLLADLQRWASQRAYVQRSGAVVGFADLDHEADVLVQDAIGMTALGERRWDPDVPLYDHLCGVIRSLSSHAVERAKSRGDQSLEGADGIVEPDGAAPRAATSRRGLRRRGFVEAVRYVIAPLRDMAARDVAVNQLLDAYESGCTTRREVLAVTTWSRAEYLSARRKLDRLLAKLPLPTLAGVRDAMEITYG